MKVICGLVIIPLGFLPLTYLSYTSIVGIVASLMIAVAIIIDGLIKAEGPGSLRDPRPTQLWPSNWKAVPLALGLLMGEQIPSRPRLPSLPSNYVDPIHQT